ncbi:MAG: hypothetical protein IT280_00230 [Ignavibacteria bacterium]|nr:hypothetical protein [Ignavibacteria bacterium]
MLKFNVLTLFLIVFSSLSISQIKYTTTNYYGIDAFYLMVSNSEDGEYFKDILMNESDIKNIIAYKTGLKALNDDTGNDINKTIFIQVNYQINKNPYSEEQYYGNYELRVLRVLNIPNSELYTIPHAEIFSSNTSFVNNFPIKSAWKKEIKEIITNLIEQFALDYRSSN